MTKFILKISSCFLTKSEAQPTELMSYVKWLDSSESHDWGDKPKQGTYSCFGTAMMSNCLQNKDSSLFLFVSVSLSFFFLHHLSFPPSISFSVYLSIFHSLTFKGSSSVPYRFPDCQSIVHELSLTPASCLRGFIHQAPYWPCLYNPFSFSSPEFQEFSPGFAVDPWMCSISN